MESITDVWFIGVRPAITFGIIASFGGFCAIHFLTEIMLMLSYLLDLGQVLSSYLLCRSFYVAYYWRQFVLFCLLLTSVWLYCLLFRSIYVILFVIEVSLCYVIEVSLCSVIEVSLCFLVLYLGRSVLHSMTLLSRPVHLVLSAIEVSLYYLIIVLVSLYYHSVVQVISCCGICYPTLRCILMCHLILLLFFFICS